MMGQIVRDALSHPLPLLHAFPFALISFSRPQSGGAESHILPSEQGGPAFGMLPPAPG